MPKPLRTLLLILLWIFVLGGGFVVFWVRDAALVQPAIEAELDATDGTQ
jgi:hypothetical protein